MAEFLQRRRVLVDIAFIGGDDLAERRPGGVEIDLEDRVGARVPREREDGIDSATLVSGRLLAGS
jgi:hypothetical protein